MREMGLSLIELLIVMSIVCIFLSIGLADYSFLWHKNKTQSMVNQIITALNMTRTQAIAHNKTIIFCGSSDQMHCDGQWSKGQIIKDDNETLLREYSALSGGDQLSWRGNLGIDNYLKYAPTGFTEGQDGSFYYCPRDIREGAIIVVSFSGRVRVNYDSQDVAKGCHSF